MNNKRYQASSALCAFIRSQAGKYRLVSYDTLPTIERIARTGIEPDEIPIWQGGSEHTIYPDAMTNYAFRAWHDRLHIKLRAPFNADGELRVAQLHVLMLAQAGLRYDDRMAIWYDVWGQFRYAQMHDGQFPTNQAAFVQACFSVGVGKAIAKEF